MGTTTSTLVTILVVSANEVVAGDMLVLPTTEAPLNLNLDLYDPTQAPHAVVTVSCRTSTMWTRVHFTLNFQTLQTSMMNDEKVFVIRG